ncbi:unnamed protein product [Leuciscus chuanchicus]
MKENEAARRKARRRHRMLKATVLCTRLMQLGVSKRRLWMVQRPQGAVFWSNVLENFNEDQWWQHFRMSRDTFEFVLQLVELSLRRKLTNCRKPLEPRRRLAIVLWWYATPGEYRTISCLFGVGLSTVCTLVHEVTATLKTKLLKRFISLPKGEALQKALNGFAEPLQMYVGWPGRTHDARVLSNSPIFKMAEQQGGYLFPRENSMTVNDVEVPVHLIADVAYPLKNWLMKGFTNHHALTPQQRHFNYRLSSARMVVENAFGRLKGRWRPLLNGISTTTPWPVLTDISTTTTPCGLYRPLLTGISTTTRGGFWILYPPLTTTLWPVLTGVFTTTSWPLLTGISTTTILWPVLTGVSTTTSWPLLTGISTTTTPCGLYRPLLTRHLHHHSLARPHRRLHHYFLAPPHRHLHHHHSLASPHRRLHHYFLAPPHRHLHHHHSLWSLQAPPHRHLHHHSLARPHRRLHHYFLAPPHRHLHDQFMWSLQAPPHQHLLHHHSLWSLQAPPHRDLHHHHSLWSLQAPPHRHLLHHHSLWSLQAPPHRDLHHHSLAPPHRHLHDQFMWSLQVKSSQVKSSLFV